MAIKLIGMENQGTRGVVCFESDIEGPDFSSAIAELKSGNTRHEALKIAAENGLSRPGAELSMSAYPVDAEGKEVKDAIKQRVHRYRIDIPVTQPAV
jgi:hypothetical protein